MTPAEFRAALPQFVDYTDAVIQPAIDASLVVVSDYTVFDPSIATTIQAWVTAHILVTLLDPSEGTARGANDATMEKRATLNVSRDPKLLQVQALNTLHESRFGRWAAPYIKGLGMGGAAA